MKQTGEIAWRIAQTMGPGAVAALECAPSPCQPSYMLIDSSAEASHRTIYNILRLLLKVCHIPALFNRRRDMHVVDPTRRMKAGGTPNRATRLPQADPDDSSLPARSPKHVNEPHRASYDRVRFEVSLACRNAVI